MATYNPGSAFTPGSGYGPRPAPGTGILTNHNGQDYSAPAGTPIPAAADGTVYKVYSDGELSGYGNAIVIEHCINGEKCYTLYAHLQSMPTLNEGDSVSQGQDVGNVGSTGRSSGPHLHFEVIPGNQPNPLRKGHDTYNPKRYDFPGGGSDGTGLSDPTVPPGSSGSGGGAGDPFGKVTIPFDQAPDNTPYHPSPIVIDLDGDGTETTALNVGTTYFDVDANGFAEATGWVSPDDGLLVCDLNGNGSIDDGTELFGDHTPIPGGVLITLPCRSPFSSPVPSSAIRP